MCANDVVTKGDQWPSYHYSSYNDKNDNGWYKAAGSTMTRELATGQRQPR
jgi:hypothetical protein